jgi:hypothetical protein
MALVRINFNTFEEGEEYQNRLIQEASREFKIFLAMLSSYWSSTIDGPNYTREIKSMVIELSRIRLALDDIRTDISYTNTRTEFMYQVISSMMFPNEIPDPGFNDKDFRNFLLQVLNAYFKGSIPSSIQNIVELLVNGQVIIKENFEEARRPGSFFDISDQFGFTVDVLLDSPSSTDTILAGKNIRILLNIIRPAHTLYRLRFILRDEYVGQKDEEKGQFSKIKDAFSWVLSNYGYEDFRKFIEGIDGVDSLGFKKVKSVIGEVHLF